jgi:Fe-Mn family superoxide dismutase
VDARPLFNERQEDGIMEDLIRTEPTGPSRRRFLGTAAVAGFALAAGTFAAPHVARAKAPFELPALPYPDGALAPTISANTIGFHYGKHHKGYVDNLNKLIGETPDLAALSLEDLIRSSAVNPNRTAIYNNAAQVWNHTFYWNSMRPGGGGKPSADILARIEADFGGWDAFVAEFTKAAMTQFGSGWAWLILDGGKLKMTKTGNADTPLTQGKPALLTIDVWEHAYYLDYQNRRGDYVKAWLEQVANWNFAADQLAKAKT